MTSRRHRLAWFLPETPDVLRLLADQGRVTLEGAEAFDRWAKGDERQAGRVRTLEHAADDARRAVTAAVRSAFTTPVEPEDLFELSERLDAVMNQMKDLVREAEILSMTPDPAMAEMSHLVATGVRDLVAAFSDLAASPDAATAAADRAIHRHRGIERVYRRAMSELVQAPDLREVAAKRELYRRYARVGDAIEHVADRVWYAVVKQG